MRMVDEEVVERVTQGSALSLDELRELATADILTLGMLADDARRAVGTRVNYERVHVVGCGEVVDGFSVPDAAVAVHVSGRPETLEQAVGIVRRVKQAAGDRRVAAFSMGDLFEAANGGWGAVDSVLRTLVDAGLNDAAEFPVDVIADVNRVVSIVRAAGLAATRLTVLHPTGSETIASLERVRQCQDALGGISSYSPLPSIVSTEKPTTGYEDVRAVALSRLALGHYVAAPIAIAVDWRLYGPKLAQVALTFGADMLTNVPATSDESLGQRRGTVEDLERNIRAAGFEPQELRPTA